MKNSPNNQVCLEYLIKTDSNNPPGVRQEISKFVTRFFEDSHSCKFSIAENDDTGSRITVREYWSEREEFQKSKSYSSLMNFYDGIPDETLIEPVKITFWDPKIGQFSIWF